MDRAGGPLSVSFYMYVQSLMSEAVHTKKNLFPVQRVAKIVASRAATLLFFFFFFLGGGGGVTKQ